MRFNPLFSVILLIAGLILLAGCYRAEKTTTESSAATPEQVNSMETKADDAKPSELSRAIETLKPGEASGTYTAEGQTVQLRYAYATRGKRFGSDSIIVLVTDQQIPSDALAAELESQRMLLDEKIRGLEYVFSDDGFWVRFHPSQYQESKSNNLKDYSIANGMVSGRDEDDGDLTNGKYARSVKFVAALP